MRHMYRGVWLIGSSIAALCASGGVFAQAAKPADGWSRRSDGSGRTLTYSGSATVLGHQPPLEARFYRDTERTKVSTGAIGFDIEMTGRSADFRWLLAGLP